MASQQSIEITRNGHRWSHIHLISRVPYYLPAQSRLALSGIMVPTSRPAGVGSGMALATQLAAIKNSTLLVVRSGAATLQPFPRAMAPNRSGRIAVIDLPAGAQGILPLWQSNRRTVATLHRNSDLGLKRNLGLLIGRMCGWDALLFMDDDIRATPASQPSGPPTLRRPDPMLRLNDVLADFDNSPDLHAAGYFQRDFDDNSVVCHARRLVGMPQETFISGGALAVRCAGPLPLFSAAYNEDWLFFLHLMLDGRHTCPSSAVKYVGTVHQDEYYPFTMPRALSEELGDLLAEGLFTLVGDPRENLLATASSPHFWQQAIEARCQMITELLTELYRRDGGSSAVVLDARKALHAALNVYASTDAAAALAEFFTAYLCDLDEWAALLASVTPASPADALSVPEALELLGLDRCTTWYGNGPGLDALPRQRVS
jgi:hypothetical protein